MPGRPPALSTLSASRSPTAIASSAEAFRVAGSGSAVKVTFLHAEVRTSGASDDPVSDFRLALAASAEACGSSLMALSAAR